MTEHPALSLSLAKQLASWVLKTSAEEGNQATGVEVAIHNVSLRICICPKQGSWRLGGAEIDRQIVEKGCQYMIHTTTACAGLT